MANHTTLPIYKVAYDLLNVVTELVKNMPRDFKRSIGGKIADECVEIVVLIFRANCAVDKAPYLSELIERLQVANLLLRLSKDKQLRQLRRRYSVLGKGNMETINHYLQLLMFWTGVLCWCGMLLMLGYIWANCSNRGGCHQDADEHEADGQLQVQIARGQE